MQKTQNDTLLFSLLALTVIAFSPTFFNDFVAFDDPLLITQNPIVRTFSMEHVMEAFTTFDPELYIPLPILSYQIEYLLFGANPLAYHTTNLLLHLLCIALLFFLMDALFKKRSITLLVTLLFALHPINVEAVAWAAGRKDLLAAAFALATCLSYGRWHQTKERTWFFLALGFFACGLLSKVTIIGLPFILLLIESLQGASLKSLQEWKRLLPFFGLSLIFLTIALFGKSDAWALESLSLTRHIAFAGIGLFFPLTKLFFWSPTFSVVYPVQDIALLPILIIALCAIALVVFSVARSTQTMRRTLLFGVILYAVMLLPSLGNLVKAGEAYAGSDRYVYLASIGIFLLCALALDHFFKKEKSIDAIVIGMGIILVPLTAFQVSLWSNTRTLFEHALTVAPHSAVTHLILGGECLTKKDNACALQEYKQANVLLPNAKTFSALASVHEEMLDDSGAGELYTQALEMDPTYGRAFLGLGMIAYRQKNTDAEIDFLQKALRWTSDRVSLDDRVFIHTNLAAAYAQKGNLEQEIAHERAAIVLDPLFAPAHYNLAAALDEAGQHEDAQKERQKAYSLDPSLQQP